MYGRIRHIHFVGIGGIGMSGIAEILMNLGYKVSGSDIKKSDITKRLTDMGAHITYEHRPENIKDADVIVVSSAVRPENPELKAARDMLIPVIPRAEMLAELMRLKYGIAIAGAHGKTTTTAMVASVLLSGGFDPTVIIGGKLDAWGSNAKLGEGSFLVAEADESDGSFLHLSPAISVVTNIDLEHLDYYGSIEKIKDTFLAFMNKVPFYGLAIICLDDPYIQDLIPSIKKRYFTYGLQSQANLRAVKIETKGLSTQYQLYKGKEKIADIEISFPGIHNVYNSLAAISVGLELGISMEKIQHALKHLSQIQRRFQIRGERQGVIVLDDYGHHPTEIKATLKTAQETWPEKRTFVVFQPHRYTRTKFLYTEFAQSFYGADVLLVLPIYPAGELPIEGVSAKALVSEIKRHGHKAVYYMEDKEKALIFIEKNIKEGDILITLGAGDVWQVGNSFLKKEGK